MIDERRIVGESDIVCEPGRLRVYLAIAPGAGKTYAMLAEAKQLAERGVDVVVGLVETHARADTEAMLASLEQIPLAHISHRGSTFDELDLANLLARRPAVVLVDELGHTCVPGGRHEKRWEDVQELLTAGIDVITALNVQHIDSLSTPSKQSPASPNTRRCPTRW